MSEGGTATFNNGVVVGGDLTVQGTTVTLNTATLDVEDKNITLNAGSGDTSGSANGAGITIQDAVDASNDATILWDAGNDKFDFSHPVNISHGTPVLTLTDTSSSATTTITLDGVNTTIDSNGTDGDIIFKGNDGGSEITALTLDMSAGGSASFSHDIYLLDNNRVYFGSDSDMEILHEGSYGMINNTTGNLFIRNNADDSDIVFQTDDGSGGIATYITIDGSADSTLFSKKVRFSDNVKAAFGGSDDLEIFHDGNNSVISETGAGSLKMMTGALLLRSPADADMMEVQSGGAITLFHNTVEKLKTFSGGIDVSGVVYTGGSTAQVAGIGASMGDVNAAELGPGYLSLARDDTADAKQILFEKNDVEHSSITTKASSLDIASEQEIVLDSAGDITLDADGANIKFKNGGVEFGQILTNATPNDFVIRSSISDEDIVFQGNDGGTIFGALTLDMSAAGKATFNASVTAPQFLVSGNTGVQGIQIGQDASNSSNSGRLFFTESGGSWAIFNSNDTLSFHNGGTYGSSTGTQRAFLTAAGNLNIDGTYAGDVVSAHTTENTVANDDVIAFYDTSAGAIRKTAVSNLPGGSGGSSAADDITTGDAAVTIATSTGDITLDTPGDIILDADGGDILFKDGGSHFFSITKSSTHALLHNPINNGDIQIKGIDDGSAITAITIDMSEGGSATFNKDIMLSDNSALRLGTGQDLALFHDGADSTIRNTTGNLILDVAGDIVLDADGGEFKFLDGGTENLVIGKIGSAPYLYPTAQDSDFKILGNDGGSQITALTLDMSEAGAATFNNNVTAFSDERLKDNIETLEDGLAKVEQLRGVTYTRNDKENIGVIAQEVEKILPEIVLTADDEMGTKSVDYSRIPAVLIEAVKELSERVKELENK